MIETILFHLSKDALSTFYTIWHVSLNNFAIEKFSDKITLSVSNLTTSHSMNNSVGYTQDKKSDDVIEEIKINALESIAVTYDLFENIFTFYQYKDGRYIKYINISEENKVFTLVDKHDVRRFDFYSSDIMFSLVTNRAFFMVYINLSMNTPEEVNKYIRSAVFLDNYFGEYEFDELMKERIYHIFNLCENNELENDSSYLLYKDSKGVDNLFAVYLSRESSLEQLSFKDKEKVKLEVEKMKKYGSCFPKIGDAIN